MLYLQELLILQKPLILVRIQLYRNWLMLLRILYSIWRTLWWVDVCDSIHTSHMYTYHITLCMHITYLYVYIQLSVYKCSLVPGHAVYYEQSTFSLLVSFTIDTYLYISSTKQAMVVCAFCKLPLTVFLWFFRSDVLFMLTSLLAASKTLLPIVLSQLL